MTQFVVASGIFKTLLFEPTYWLVVCWTYQYAMLRPREEIAIDE